ncbi:MULTISPECIES: SDR family NAD(P)-dependent oxidoreductase [Thermomonospora]|jgi:short-subunit dehydrogenase|uniref:Short-chain dehydrogenase/reductase SDR n=1 Tax=Thermomonospora curvata (strain ATCC 19995 / DSM 43183 / JCM 3096 / KCTC 9072 / NBRC 15933 / NCIMB 10081 / Henssen B9) TaxID=471852 RepID=D1ACR7_THECD|nr:MULTISPECIES: SDR family oxidoreductase [Thermomonospora]ACY97406.1 short-chain dehydrogenase/reductase SDR [Thermomonospora curvata DSM 43183]PKK14760.1 MAG: NAD(P)-dependent oxidoreductase [Thermomonospora sp. CIF 1]
MPTALITGATAGIGAGFARRLASDGFDLVLVARDTARLERTAAELHDRYGVATETLRADLSTDEGLAAAEERAGKGIDLLINNAGFGQRGVYLDVPVSDEIRMLRVHCEAVLRLTSAALPGMLERGRGGVINVASVAAFFSRGTYGASKAWVVSFSQAVMRDLGGRGVHVMALCPGFVHTEFHERAGMNMDGIPGFMWIDQDLVIDTALRDLRRGVQVSIPSARYKAIVALGKVVPRALADRISSRAGRRFD